MSERIMTLSVSFGNDAAVAARIGDFCGDELTSFLALRGLAPATALDVARDDGERIRRGHHRAVDTPRSTSRRLPAEIVLPRWPLCRNR
jgi:hypothetical protein